MKQPDFSHVATNSWKVKLGGKYLGWHGQKWAFRSWDSKIYCISVMSR